MSTFYLVDQSELSVPSHQQVTVDGGVIAGINRGGINQPNAEFSFLLHISLCLCIELTSWLISLDIFQCGIH